MQHLRSQRTGQLGDMECGGFFTVLALHPEKPRQNKRMGRNRRSVPRPSDSIGDLRSVNAASLGYDLSCPFSICSHSCEPPVDNPMHLPDFQQFEQLAKTSEVVPVYRRLLADTLTP